MKKALCVLVLALALVLLALPVQVMAATALSNPATNLSASIDGTSHTFGAAYSGKASTGSVWLKVGALRSAMNGTLTLKNEGSETAQLSFSYSLSGTYSSCTIAGNAVTGSNVYSIELDPDESIAIYLAVPGYEEATITLSNVKLEIPQAANATISHNAGGSVSVGGTTVASGTTVEVSAAGTTIKATPASGASFVGWVNSANNSVYSTEATLNYVPTGDISLKAIFAGPSAATFWCASKTYLFDDLNAAITFASSASNKVITLAASGTLPAGDYTIPSGVTLVIPFDSAGTWYKDTPGCDETNWTKPSAFYTLTMKNGANIIVNGAISVSAKVTAKMGYSGNPTSKYGHVAMEKGSTIMVNNGANLYAWGYITGSGNVTIKSGGTVYEAFQVTDWRGGTYTTKMLDNSQKVFPMSQYYVQNVEAPMTLESGAMEKCSLSAVISSILQQKTVPFIGQSGHMFNITSGSMTKRYDGSADRLIIDINGSFNVGNISIVMSEGFIGIGRVEIKSANYVLPVNHNITLNINGGSTVTLNQTASFLPGVQANIAEGATLKVNSGKQLFVYDASEWVGKGYIYYPKGLTDFASVPYAPGRSYTRTTAADIVDTKIKVNGTLDASEGKLYTTAGGSNIYSTGNGLVKLSAADSSQKLYETTQTSDSPAYAEIPITAAQLKNGNGDYVATEAGDYVYDATHQKWALTAHTVTDEVTNPTCQKTGYTTHKCTCGYEAQDSETAVIPCADVEPLDGKCDMCGTVLCEHPERIAVGEAKNPTCTEKGITAGEKCSTCGTIIVAQEEISALGHTPGEAATCTTAQTCTVCNAELAAALNHDFSGAWQKDDTNHWKKCSRCDATDQNDAHSMDDWIVDTAATCTTAGSQHKECAICAHTVTEAIDALGHNMVSVEAKAATCTEAGYNAHTDCSRCDYTEGKSVISATGHNYGAATYDWAEDYSSCTVSVTCDECAENTENKTLSTTDSDLAPNTIPGTCQTEAKTTYTASVELNGTTYTQSKTVTGTKDTNNHTNVVTDAAVAATCTTNGLTEGKHCSACNQVLVEQEVVDALGHTEVTDVAVAATCTATGKTEGKHCSVCGEIIVAQTEVAAKGHTNGNAVIENNVDATCTADGSYDTVVYCTVCNAELSREKITVDAKGHTEVIDAAKEATCTATGLTEGKHCSVCGEIIVAQTEVAAKGHTAGETVVENKVEATCGTEGSYDEVVYCSVCNAELSRKTETVAATGAHNYVTETKHVEATCTTNGYIIKACVCGATETTTLNATGHTAGAEATCTTAQTCTICGIELQAALGHTNGNAVMENNVDATCTADGSYDTVVYCTVCNAEVSRVATTVSTNGHTEGKVVVENNVDPNCENTGSYDNVIRCTVCGEEISRETVTVDALGHAEVSHEAKAPTCTESGWDAYVTCSRCDYTTYVEKAALSHDEVAHEAKAPTCTEIGWDAYVTCSRCDYTTYAEKAALSHDEVAHEAKAPTCTEVGWDAYVTCSRCDYTTYVEKAALDHDFAEELSYDENGHWYACTRTNCTEKNGVENHDWDHACDTDCNDGCGYTRTITHSYTEASEEVVIEANCVTNAVYKAKCAVCGDVSDTERITGTTDATKHTGKTDVRGAKDATCVAMGYTGDTHCSDCNELLTKGTAIEMLTTHTYPDTWTQTKAPTCTEKGSEYRKCTVEGCESTETRDIDMVAHSMSHTAAKDATCAEAGNHEYWYCSVCKGYFKDEQGTEAYAENAWVIGTTEHIFETTYTTDGQYHWYECTNSECDEVNGKAAHSHGDKWKYDETNHWHECACGDKADLAEHGWDDGVVTTQPTFSAAGVMTYTCGTCGTTRTETIDKLTGTTVSLDVLTNNLETGPQIALLTGTTAGEGWDKEGNVIAGSAVDFSVTFDKACVVIVETTDTDGKLVYTKVPAVATADKNTYNFSTNVVEGMRIIVAVKGDLDSNGKINSTDAMKMQQAEVGLLTLEKIQKVICDIDGNNKINSTDAMLAQQVEVGLTSLAWDK